MRRTPATVITVGELRAGVLSATTAMSLDLPVVTQDRDFPVIDGLDVIVI